MQSKQSIARNSSKESKDYGRVLEFLRDELVAGGLKEGEFLLPERELASKLGVSRSTMREALSALAMLGIVETRHGVGTSISRLDAASISTYFTFLLASDSHVMGDIMEARIAIEYRSIMLACELAKDKDFRHLESAFGAIANTIDDPVAGSMADFQFHRSIVCA